MLRLKRYDTGSGDEGNVRGPTLIFYSYCCGFFVWVIREKLHILRECARCGLPTIMDNIEEYRLSIRGQQEHTPDLLTSSVSA